MDAGDMRQEAATSASLTLADPDVRHAVARFSASGGPIDQFAEQIAERRAEYDGLVGLLLVHSTPGVNPCEAEAAARALAAGCLGEQHLWRDLELPTRAALRKLFEAYFEPLAADNIMDMRWKKFLYRKLCRWGGFNTCRAPSCGVCSSYAECFGPEV